MGAGGAVGGVGATGVAPAASTGAAGAEGTIKFYLDNNRTDGTNEVGTQLQNGVNGVTIAYDNATGNYTLSFATGSAA